MKYKKLDCCTYCDINFEVGFDVANHVRWCTSNPNKKSYKKYSIKKCEKCNSNFSHPRNKYCSVECSTKVSESTKKHMSRIRSEYLEKNPDNHPWKNKDKFKSTPCEIVKKYLTSKNITFVEEFNPIDDRFFSIDIAFPDIKFGIEINGNQHYNRDGTLKEYYQQRHDTIVCAGWELIELHYSVAWNLKIIDDIIISREQPDYSEYINLKKEKLKNRPEAPGVKYSRKISEKWEPYKKMVELSDIDFSKFGWGVKLSKILGISPQKSKKWMERYFPEIFNTQCFKVKRNKK